jgi:hypothetical protein
MRVGWRGWRKEGSMAKKGKRHTQEEEGATLTRRQRLKGTKQARQISTASG